MGIEHTVHRLLGEKVSGMKEIAREQWQASQNSYKNSERIFLKIPASQQDASMKGLSEQSQFVANNEQVIMGSKILERKKFEREFKSEIVALKNDIDVDSVVRFATLCTLFAGGAMVLNYLMASVNEKSEKKEEKDRKLKMKM